MICTPHFYRSHEAMIHKEWNRWCMMWTLVLSSEVTQNMPFYVVLKESSKIKPENILCSHLKNICFYCLVTRGGNSQVKTKHIFSSIWTCLELEIFKWRRQGQ